MPENIDGKQSIEENKRPKRPEGWFKNPCICLSCLHQWYSASPTEGRILCPKCHNNAYPIESETIERMKAVICRSSKCQHIWFYRGNKKLGHERICCPMCHNSIPLTNAKVGIANRLYYSEHHDYMRRRLQNRFPKASPERIEEFFFSGECFPPKA